MALTRLAVLETYLKDLIVNEETILSSVEAREHIFEIKDSEHTLGFISLYDLKAYVYEHEEEAKNYWIRNIDSTDWKNIFDHQFFQRRKPQLISVESLTDADDLEFYILQKGQKTGPYEKYELMEKVENKEILLSDMVSYNAGMTWVKLFLVDGFERRSLKNNDQLPGVPDEEFLNKASGQIKSIGDAIEAISSLAYLGNQKKGNTQERERENIYRDEMEKKAQPTSVYKWLLVFSVLGIAYFLYNIKANLKSPFGPAPSSVVGEQADMLTPTELSEPFNAKEKNNYQPRNGINDQKRKEKFEPRVKKTVRNPPRKTFLETNKFKDTTESTTTAEDSNYYYDNAAPMELDPVRAQISKENFDNGGEATLPEPTPSIEPSLAPEASDALFTNEVSN